MKDFAELYNAETFRNAMHVRGVVRRGPCSARWEVQVEDGNWATYEDEASAAIESASQQSLPRLDLRLGPRGPSGSKLTFIRRPTMTNLLK